MSAISPQFAGRLTAGDFPEQRSAADDHMTGKAHPQSPGVSRLLPLMEKTRGQVAGDTAWVGDPDRVYGISSENQGSTFVGGVGRQG